MQKVPKILLFFCLAGFMAVLSSSVFASEIQKEFSAIDTELTSASDSDALLYSTQFPVLHLSEIEIESGAEIEPKESETATSLSAADLRFDTREYLNKSKRLLISLAIRDLIFPFHTHF
ncbi:hypothetical protein [Rhodohalobacter sp.]|uniref:hypothetical protein n=1 Tax=Rhodohalobacter sp. TaxID=1974210 RepID=UPI002ACE38E6|nr:hypothetical protein [Rhodohalobacter sp.]MDZ7755760.1 hypothetical protein [Rhodohalobacter sp.]